MQCHIDEFIAMSPMKISHIGSIPAYIFFFTVGWTGLSLGHEWLRPYVITATLLLAYLILRLLSRPVISRRVFGPVELCLVVFFAYCLTLGIFYPNTKTVSYLLAYAVVFLFSYIVPRVYLLTDNKYSLVMRANAYGVAFICLFAILEVIAKSLWNVHIIDFLPKSKPDVATTTFGDIRIHRAYSLMPEPTILGMYLNTLGLLALYWAHSNTPTLTRMLFYVIFAAAYMLAGSSAAIISLVAAILLFLAINTAALRPIAARPFVVIIGLFMLVFSALLMTPSGDFIRRLGFVKKLLDPSTYSSTRFQLWLDGIEAFKKSDGIGNGLGYISAYTDGSYINWYLSLIIESGIVGTAAIIGLLLISAVTAWRLEKSARPWFFVAILAGSIHFFAVSTFFNPYLFVVIAIMPSINHDWLGVSRYPMTKHRRMLYAGLHE